MEKLLARLAQQLDTIDEASLMSLWSKYATTTSRFEPTKRWEEATLIFSLIQAKRWKNQLFNFHWSRQSQGQEGLDPQLPNLAPDFALETPQEPAPAQRCRVLEFRPLKQNSENGENDGK
ncbi:MAG: hypothetical protein QM579_12235 [Desulfovibrio sp.]|uniref:hypothetical protein n=1 Tax=Desulfovibrio sp. TaxID=885 RepID=UPI0039E2C7EA